VLEPYRSLFNAAYGPARFDAYTADLERRLGCACGFRLAETPVFLSTGFRNAAVRAGEEILAQLRDPARLDRMTAAVPLHHGVPRRTALPTFAILDFAAVRDPDGGVVPKLVELQGFPSLMAFETMQGDAWEAALAQVSGLAGPWTYRFAGRTRDEFLELARSVIVGEHDPKNVVLLDLDPPAQKTYCDFAATQRLFGVDPVAPEDLVQRGRKLYRRDALGTEIPVRRIYNRIIVDELERTNAVLPFDLREDLDVEWTPHPDWFFIWSKYSLPFLDHPAVPRTRFLSDVSELPHDLAREYVLKPLFSFAGGGVNVRPTPEDVAAVAPAERSGWCLQERIEYGGVIRAPDGGSAKAEVRLMFLRPDNAADFTPAINLCRLTRGEMVGVNYNRDLDWTGSTIGMWRDL
jgi:hypothetical protein